MEELFAAALINRRRYWPTLVSDNAIGEYFETKSVGGTDDISGKWKVEWNQIFYLGNERTRLCLENYGIWWHIRLQLMQGGSS